MQIYNNLTDYIDNWKINSLSINDIDDPIKNL
jgi:hypothetical protein